MAKVSEFDWVDGNLSALLKKHYEEMVVNDGWIVLLDVSADKVLQANLESMRLLANEFDFSGIVVDVNRPYSNLVNLLEKHSVNLNNLFFVDAISKDVGAKLSLNQNVSYLGSPRNLTDISIEVERLVPKLLLNKKFLFLDSITTLAAYNSIPSVTKFSHFMTSKMRALNLSGVVISMEQNTHPEIYSSLAQVCDRIIKL